MTPEEQGTEDWLGENIKYTVESGLGVGVSDVSAPRKTPKDRIEEPQKYGLNAAHQESAVYFRSENKGVLAGNPDDVPCNTEEGHAESEVSPPVRRGDESTNKTDNNHDLFEEQSEQDCGPWQTCSQEEIEEEKL